MHFSRREIRTWHYTGAEQELGRALGRSFTLVTWNAWFGEHEREARIDGLIRELEEIAPDLVCLQEATIDLVHRLTASEWARRYFLSDGEGATVDPHGVLLMSRVPFRALLEFELPTSMERKLIVGIVEAAGEPLAV